MIDRTDELLATLDADTADRAWWLIYSARVSGIPMHIISARRSPEVNRDVNGASKSLHLTGQAFDVAVLGYRREDIPFEWWQSVGQWAESRLGLRWGGRFLHAGALDVNHFDTARISA